MKQVIKMQKNAKYGCILLYLVLLMGAMSLVGVEGGKVVTIDDGTIEAYSFTVDPGSQKADCGSDVILGWQLWRNTINTWCKNLGDYDNRADGAVTWSLFGNTMRPYKVDFSDPSTPIVKQSRVCGDPSRNSYPNAYKRETGWYKGEPYERTKYCDPGHILIQAIAMREDFEILPDNGIKLKQTYTDNVGAKFTGGQVDLKAVNGVKVKIGHKNPEQKHKLRLWCINPAEYDLDQNTVVKANL